MRAPDVEAGWAALAAQLEPPLAPVVPLRKPSPRADRGACRGRGAAGGRQRVRRGVALRGRTRRSRRAVHRPHPPARDRTAHARTVRRSTAGSSAERSASRRWPSPRQPATGPNRRRRHDATAGSRQGTTKPGDDPNDRDQGTGNDGQHNDHGAATTAPRARRNPTHLGRLVRPRSLGPLSPFLGTFSRISRISRPVPSMGRVTTPGHPTPSPSADGSWSPTLAPPPWTWLHRKGRPSGRLFRVSGLRSRAAGRLSGPRARRAPGARRRRARSATRGSRRRTAAALGAAWSTPVDASRSARSRRLAADARCHRSRRRPSSRGGRERARPARLPDASAGPDLDHVELAGIQFVPSRDDLLGDLVGAYRSGCPAAPWFSDRSHRSAIPSGRCSLEHADVSATSATIATSSARLTTGPPRPSRPCPRRSSPARRASRRSSRRAASRS